MNELSITPSKYPTDSSISTSFFSLDIRSPVTPSETKSPGKLLSRIPTTKSFDSDSEEEGFDSVSLKSPPKKGI